MNKRAEKVNCTKMHCCHRALAHAAIDSCDIK